MSVLFVANQHKTIFYAAVAATLRARGIATVWVSPSTHWTKYLAAQGWTRDAILSLPDFAPQWMSRGSQPPDENRAKRIETAGKTTFKAIAIMDRELTRQTGRRSEAYLDVAAGAIEDFVRRHAVAFGFGEPTWAPEMLAAAALRTSGGRYFVPHTIRVPSTRFGFFEGIFHDALAPIGEATPAHRTIARDAIAAVRTRGLRPYYAARGARRWHIRRHWLREAAVALTQPHAHRFDHTVPPLPTRIARRVRVLARAQFALRGNIFERPQQPGQRPYVLVPLHVQPEASVDVFGAPMSNQLEVVRALARLLPASWEIWIKEHAPALGMRSRATYRAFASLPGARLIDPRADSWALMRDAGLVASVAGTASLEAALLGVPALTFGRLPWDGMLLANGFDPFGATPKTVADLLARAEGWRDDPAQAQRAEDGLTDMIAQSFEGLISDPVSDPECLAAANVAAVAAAMMTVMAQPHPAP